MIRVNGEIVELGHFPDGTLLLKGINLDGCDMEWKFESNEELVAIQFIVEHLKDNGVLDISLKMPYIPNARQDRVKSSDDVFTLKYFAKIINSMEFSQVKVLDPHSKVSHDLINNLVIETPEHYIKDVLDTIKLDDKNDVIFYPDKGARDRYDGMIGHQCAYGIKVRDWDTGKIKGLDVSGIIPKEPFNALIVDDISSYGGTFYHSAKKLKELGADRIYLFVSHCENSILAGELIKSNLLSGIFTTDSLFSKNHELITIIKNK